MPTPHANARLEAFCDGVFAIALTLLIIEVRLPAVEVTSSSELWGALSHVAKTSVFAFLLSFVVIFITWVNHHAALDMVHKTSGAFIFANGFLLLSVVFIPFPTALLAEHLWTDHAAPAVVLYNAVIALQSVGWILLTGTALREDLIDERSRAAARENHRNGYAALVLYSLLALAAFWVPMVAAIVTTASFVFWLLLAIRLKRPGARAV